MGLLETVHRKLVKTGAILKLLHMLPRISLLLTLFSIIFMVSLAMDGQYRNTYISENALMPGQAHSFFRESEWNHVRGFRNEIVNMMNDNLNDRNLKIEQLLISMGYKTNILNYTDPITGIEKPTLYAIYHVPKGDDTEAMVLATPWFNRDGELNVGAMSLTLGLSRYFRRLSIWAKNIIIVIPEDSGSTLRNWVDAYHTTLDNTGGSIESALVLDCPTSSDYIGYIEIEYSGVNGQLPNLDLFNTVVQICDNENIKASVNNAPYGQLWTNDFYSRVNSLFNGIFEIASAGVLDVCDAQSFSGWNIQALTIRAKEGDRTDITSFGRVIDNTFRSVNNLLEKFHQSFFFYLLMGTRQFVSVGMYLPASAMSAFAFVVASANAWIGGNNSTINSINLNNSAIFNTTSLILAAITAILVTSCTVGFGLYTSTLSPRPDAEFTDIMYHWFALPLFALLFLSPFISLTKLRVNSDYSRALSSISLFFLGYTLVGLMILNFALSFIISICAAPLCFIKFDSKFVLKEKLRNLILLFLSCPALWLLIFGFAYGFGFNTDRIRNLVQYFEYPLLQREIQHLLDTFEQTPLERWFDGPVKLFAGLVSGYSKIQCFTWLFICFTWIPVWINMLIVSCIPIKSTASSVSPEKKNQ
ncbi:hypothetical protein CANINC_004144 [Pichia inconspicua]|uniref:Gaa1-like GPI transamidase component n=1 Tax=Pichia inconspicua TaxID=52247 RepID=A0A4T0WX11_9ASCO|nr:hypothetical protein CANINC_004144 [[Candida] inconspicua]